MHIEEVVLMRFEHLQREFDESENLNDESIENISLFRSSIQTFGRRNKRKYGYLLELFVLVDLFL
jgi:hypothetical protein